MLTAFGFLDVPELAIFLVIALVVFGPGKLPDIGKSLGKGIAEFKKAAEGKTTGSNDEEQKDKHKDEETGN
ncbi:Sec-independent protein translocase TatA [Desulfosporosinus acidiphilus SJ4]|uniref:Sec-independent protein translocase protein TatA n=1 Tax=Desulfosporosinus acidiphilus (strain DSM 22704 / JCM 16185 / SJ4) TaxID=646529 RepID=I4D7B3_DESAJ|nr:twin-arginine translocase TatA/TatE family subunit [Desulfosporosinus acidiphilus]AFM41687.1 Sec-independent protein translocase TatA [Desulfosporosinus acidiphilus SJ4]